MEYTIRPSNRKDKKLDLVIEENGKKKKTISFGSKGMSDFTLHKDPERKQRYLDRHHNEQEKGLWKDNKANLQTPAYLSEECTVEQTYHSNQCQKHREAIRCKYKNYKMIL